MTGGAPKKTRESFARRLQQWKLWLASFCCAAAAVLLVVYSPLAAEGAREGLSVCAQVILPTLFPFFVLSGLFTSLAQRSAALQRPRRSAKTRWMERLFGQPPAAAGVLLISVLGGYPIGAKSAVQLYERRLLTRRQAQCLSLYCVNAGPAYVIGVVGAALLGSRQAGVIALISLVMASLLLGIATKYLFLSPNAAEQTADSSPQSPNDGVERLAAPQVLQKVIGQALGAVLNVCAWVVLFSCLCALLQLLPASLHPAIPALNAALEVSSGVVKAVRAGSNLPVICAILGWGGLGVHCQILGDLRKVGLRLRWFWATRAIHGALAAAICSQILRWFPLDAAATALTAGGRSVQLWAISAPAAAALLLFCTFLILDLDLNRKIC